MTEGRESWNFVRLARFDDDNNGDIHIALLINKQGSISVIENT